MLLWVAGVQTGVVGLAGLDHFPKIFREPLAQTAQGVGVTFTLGPLLPVVDLGSGTNPEGALGPKMDNVSPHYNALGDSKRWGGPPISPNFRGPKVWVAPGSEPNKSWSGC